MKKIKIGSSYNSEEKKKAMRAKRRTNRVLVPRIILNYCEGRKRKRAKEEVIEIASNSKLVKLKKISLLMLRMKKWRV